MCEQPVLEVLSLSGRTYEAPSTLHCRMRCRSGDRCSRPAMPGSRFCKEHAEQLRRIRKELKQEASQRIGRGKPKRGATCCRPGCFQPRVPPSAYCDECAAAGYVEDPA